MEETKEYMFKAKFFAEEKYEQDVALVEISFMRNFSSRDEAVVYFIIWLSIYNDDFGKELCSAKIYTRNEEQDKIEVAAVLCDVK